MEKGIYLSFSHTLTGEVYQTFQRTVEEEARKYVQSDEGRKDIAKAVKDVIKHTIETNNFTFSYREDERFQQFKEIVTNAVMAHLLDTVKSKT